MKLFKKAKSRFYWFDFTVRGQRYRGSTGETKSVRATKAAGMKLARALEHGDFFRTKATVLAELSEIPELVGRSQNGRENEEVLQKRLPPAEGHDNLQHAVARNYNRGR